MPAVRSQHAVAALAAMLMAAPASAGFEPVANFGDNPGALHMYRYVPAGMPAGPRPLVLALHGCTQTAQAYRSAGWEGLADEHGFYVVYPEQDPNNNPARCFNWAGEYSDPTNLRRGEGENASMISMIEQMHSDFDIDRGRVFISGMAGGGAQTALMLAVWPDVFAAGATIAGIPFNCTTEYARVSTCLSPGIPREPAEWARVVYEAAPEYHGPYPRVAVWHGTNDAFVSLTNQNELVEQWTTVNGADAVADEQIDEGGHTRQLYRDDAGNVVVESWTIAGAGHGQFVDSASGCGGPGGSYVLDVGVCAAREIAHFFGITGGIAPPPPDDRDSPPPPDDRDPPPPDDRDPPTDDRRPPPGDVGPGEPPWIVVSEPRAGTILTGPTTVAFEAGSGSELVGAELFADDEPAGSDDEAPYAFEWDPAGLDEGWHQLKIRVSDTADRIAVVTLNISYQPPHCATCDTPAPGGDGPPPQQPGAPTDEEDTADYEDLPGCNHAPGGAPSWTFLLALAVLGRRRRTTDRFEENDR